MASGWAYRLWPQSQRLEPQRRAEIGQVELAGLALELAAWGSDDLRFVDAPPPGALAAARDLGLAPADCLVVGDIGADVQAALRAGARAVLVPNGATRAVEIAHARNCAAVAASLTDAVDTALAGRR